MKREFQLINQVSFRFRKRRIKFEIVIVKNFRYECPYRMLTYEHIIVTFAQIVLSESHLPPSLILDTVRPNLILRFFFK